VRRCERASYRIDGSPDVLVPRSGATADVLVSGETCIERSEASVLAIELKSRSSKMVIRLSLCSFQGSLQGSLRCGEACVGVYGLQSCVPALAMATRSRFVTLGCRIRLREPREAIDVKYEAGIIVLMKGRMAGERWRVCGLGVAFIRDLRGTRLAELTRTLPTWNAYGTDHGLEARQDHVAHMMRRMIENARSAIRS
jgi:hypothetical protein